MYKLSSFYISKSLTSLPFQSAFVFVYSVIIYFCAGLRKDAGAFLAFFALMLLQVPDPLLSPSWLSDHLYVSCYSCNLVQTLCSRPKLGQTGCHGLELHAAGHGDM